PDESLGTRTGLTRVTRVSSPTRPAFPQHLRLALLRSAQLCSPPTETSIAIPEGCGRSSVIGSQLASPTMRRTTPECNSGSAVPPCLIVPFSRQLYGALGRDGQMGQELHPAHPGVVADPLSAGRTDRPRLLPERRQSPVGESFAVIGRSRF